MGGIFDDVFDDGWGQDEESSTPEKGEDVFETDLWNTGSKVDSWTTDEPWSSEPTEEEIEKQDSFDMSDFFD